MPVINRAAHPSPVIAIMDSTRFYAKLLPDCGAFPSLLTSAAPPLGVRDNQALCERSDRAPQPHA